MSENPEFDHLLHCVPDVAAAARSYTETGMPAHANEPFGGFHNGAWVLHEGYVEILRIVDPEAFAVSPFGVATAEWVPTIERLTASGGGGLNFAVNVDDVHATAARLREAGHDVKLQEFEFAEAGVGFTEAIFTGVPAWTPFFITYRPHRREIAAKMRQQFDSGRFDLAGLVVETPRPAAAADWLAEVVRVPRDADAPIVRLPGADVHFEAGPADRVTTLLLSGAGAPDTVVDGLRFRPANGR